MTDTEMIDRGVEEIAQRRCNSSGSNSEGGSDVAQDTTLIQVSKSDDIKVKRREDRGDDIQGKRRNSRYIAGGKSNLLCLLLYRHHHRLLPLHLRS